MKEKQEACNQQFGKKKEATFNTVDACVKPNDWYLFCCAAMFTIKN